MHAQMVSQNEKEGTVMRRIPDDQGLLQPVTEETEPWCVGLEEGSDRQLPARQRQVGAGWKSGAF